MWRSATSWPPATRTAVTKGLPGGPESHELATSTASTTSRRAERKTISFTSRGAASASIQIFTAPSAYQKETRVTASAGFGYDGRHEEALHGDTEETAVGAGGERFAGPGPGVGGREPRPGRYLLLPARPGERR